VCGLRAPFCDLSLVHTVCCCTLPSRRCVGLIEGVVPPVTAADETRGAEYVKFRRAIADTAVFVEADVLIDFLKLA
jgi:hypothetical protein